jgi:GDP/UDP-N,N'-diacetylbacillosamine 2-epimerase (hydrolysing)
MIRKICVFTGSRADYGLLRKLMIKINEESTLHLQIVASGSHFTADFGSSYLEIEKDDFVIDRKILIPTSLGLSEKDVAAAIGHVVFEFAQAISELKPDLIIILGDRYEALGAALASLVHKIPIAHLHGGELTQGAFDDALRHSITKMSHLHFVATNEYRNRVIQLGEDPNKVFVVGGFGVDAIDETTLLNKESIENQLGFKFLERNLLVTFHPTTLEKKPAIDQLHELLSALSNFEDIRLIFTYANADPQGLLINNLLNDYVQTKKNAIIFSTLGRRMYHSILKQVDGVVGNSSSGILEAPTFRVGTVNVGTRQLGRVQAESIINCTTDKHSIVFAINKLYSPKFRARLSSIKNPYGKGGASDKVLKTILQEENLQDLIFKSFHNLPYIKSV